MSSLVWRREAASTILRWRFIGVAVKRDFAKGNPKVRARIDLAKRRVANILRAHDIASIRTLEQKIADAGPNAQRVEPLLLGWALSEMLESGSVKKRQAGRTSWYNLPDANSDIVASRFDEQINTHIALTESRLTTRVGQALEIAIYRALLEVRKFDFLGAFVDLDSHADDQWYTKDGPPEIVSGRQSKGPLDFILFSPGVGIVGVEAKNRREWLYPRHDEFVGFLRKCCELEAVPVLIARRISYVLQSEICAPCGIIVHEVFNQLLPESDSEIADRARHKRNLGYHDIRVGNRPDARLVKFLGTNLERLLPEAAVKFQEHFDLLYEYASGEITYPKFHFDLQVKLGRYVEPDWAAIAAASEGERDPEDEE